MRHRPGRVAARLAAITGIALLAVASVAPVAHAATVTVRIGSALDPAALRIPPGTTVTWVNDDGERHRVRSTSGPTEFDSGNLEPGASFSVRFATAGTWQYEDHRNRGLAQYRGSVTVAAGATGADGGDVAAAAVPTEAEVGMAGRAFGPADVTIAAGGTVRWTNDDDREHTVTATDGAFGSGVIAAGDGFEEAFPDPGTYRYLCAIHPEMTGAVVVQAVAEAVPPAADPSPTPIDEPAASSAVVVAPAAAATPTPTPSTAAVPDTTQVAASAPVTASVQFRQALVISIGIGALVVFAGIVRSVAHPRR